MQYIEADSKSKMYITKCQCHIIPKLDKKFVFKKNILKLEDSGDKWTVSTWPFVRWVNVIIILFKCTSPRLVRTGAPKLFEIRLTTRGKSQLHFVDIITTRKRRVYEPVEYVIDNFHGVKLVVICKCTQSNNNIMVTHKDIIYSAVNKWCY